MALEEAEAAGLRAEELQAAQAALAEEERKIRLIHPDLLSDPDLTSDRLSNGLSSYSRPTVARSPWLEPGVQASRKTAAPSQRDNGRLRGGDSDRRGATPGASSASGRGITGSLAAAPASGRETPRRVCAPPTPVA